MNDVVAIDTEFERRYTYRPILSIVQVKKEGYKPIIYDVYKRKNEDLKELLDILSDNNVIKIIHSARQDVEAIFYRFKIVIKNIFDTQLAYKYLKINDKNKEEVGYGKLVEEFCFVNITKSKKLQCSNWLKRPLTQQQIEYAYQDVEYLHDIYYKMNDLFDKESYHYKQFIEHCKVLEDKNNYTFSPNVFWQKISHKFINYPNYKFIQKMFLLREKIAFQLNIPREFVIKSNNLINFSYTGDRKFLQIHRKVNKQPFLDLFFKENL